MSECDMLEKALADVRQRRADLQGDYDRIKAELTKLQMAERSLAAIVEGTPLKPGNGVDEIEGETLSGGRTRSSRATGRGSRGPRANSAKGRLKALLSETGLQGLSHAEIARQLPDVAPGTLNAYLSTMVTSGEAVRKGDFYSAGSQNDGDDEPPAETDAEETSE